MKGRKLYAKGLRRRSGEMNKTEQEYATHLEHLRTIGRIEWFVFESINLRLADRTYYRPDFLILRSDGVLEVHEVKGFWQDDALVKIKVAADKFPFRFIAVQKIAQRDGGGWSYREF